MTDAARRLVELEAATLADLAGGYPANHFAWRFALEQCRVAGARSLVEVGVGSGNGVAHVVAADMEFSGFDRDVACVEATRAVCREVGADPARILHADVADPQSYAGLPGAGEFDALMALGVMPHVPDRDAAVVAMASLVRPGGQLFLEFRNSLFSLFTANRFTRDFIVEQLLTDASSATQERTADYLGARVDLTRPPAGATLDSYDNPLAVPAWLGGLGFADATVHPFHFHATLPALEAADPESFRQESLAMEDDASGWRGLFLCSAFLVRIVRPDPEDASVLVTQRGLS